MENTQQIETVTISAEDYERLLKLEKKDRKKRKRIKDGDLFICIKTVRMISGQIAYRKHFTYGSEEKKCITDDQGFKAHEISLKLMKKHFIRINNTMDR
jgi:hypothetical protein